jgi:cytosine/adenosine deaminase-related metal-dependent hydrolase
VRKHLYSVCVLLAFCDLAAAQLGFEPPPPPSPKLITAGRVLDVKKGSYLLNQGILTDGERIKEIGPWEQVQARAPKEAIRIDLSHATLLPGLIDCHAHLVSSMEGRLSGGKISSLQLRNRARLCGC